MDKLLKEAIADAKAVRETALANAKLALEEDTSICKSCKRVEKLADF